nr:MAG TPA: hypothetical protein [Caudoviricetes sp.]DAQ75738.1 MAG TPA: hypothetical protein [Caudoviricetes sp.]
MLLTCNNAHLICWFLCLYPTFKQRIMLEARTGFEPVNGQI